MYRRSSTHLRRLFSGHSSVPKSSSLPKPFTSVSIQSSSEAFSVSIPWRNLHSVQSFSSSCSSSSTEYIKRFQNIRLYSVETDREVDKINLKFAEAREEIESALESKETVYFDDEAGCARDAVHEVLSLYEGLLARLPESEKGAIQRSMGLKIEQLKAELAQLDE
ncbi:OLC1v1015605C1 [Oldenlandia corymbosa var. corymbosa]|uniref:OLC1v1015605C1 n=1 Tax=Oldenlandia corymbosa var. corymbosa TaxID=529605 RepID=A0AAV1E3G9_OLDCO|nr:OLC1v1015605C1 [Oldenlandia corymbosa var. corymbosa]